jgi:hypothetical protein
MTTKVRIEGWHDLGGIQPPKALTTGFVTVTTLPPAAVSAHNEAGRTRQTGNKNQPISASKMHFPNGSLDCPDAAEENRMHRLAI